MSFSIDLYSDKKTLLYKPGKNDHVADDAALLAAVSGVFQTQVHEQRGSLLTSVFMCRKQDKDNLLTHTDIPRHYQIDYFHPQRKVKHFPLTEQNLDTLNKLPLK